MATEIYLQPELEELVVDSEKRDEWMEKITALGLTGQTKLTTNSEKGSASPYTFMNEQMKLVFQTLCPTVAEVTKYDKSVIPIDVLSHIALCKQEGYFSKLEVWYDNKSPDPVLVGHLTGTYSSPLHLIARWGDEVIPYEQLLEKAIHRYTNAFVLAVRETKTQADFCPANICSCECRTPCKADVRWAKVCLEYSAIIQFTDTKYGPAVLIKDLLYVFISNLHSKKGVFFYVITLSNLLRGEHSPMERKEARGREYYYPIHPHRQNPQ